MNSEKLLLEMGFFQYGCGGEDFLLYPLGNDVELAVVRNDNEGTIFVGSIDPSAIKSTSFVGSRTFYEVYQIAQILKPRTDFEARAQKEQIEKYPNRYWKSE